MNNFKPSILIVDDIPKNIQIIGSILKDYKYDIEFATNGKEALEWLFTKKFDLVLLDIMMPEMDGFEVCHKIKEQNELNDTEIIFITAKNDSESIIKGFDLGAIDYITKPFNKKELLARIKTHLTIIEQRKELEQANAFKIKLFSIIGHDLRDPIGSLKNYIKAYLDEQQDIDKNVKNFMEDISDIAENAFHILDNLLSWAKSQTGKIGFFPKQNDLYHLVEKNLQLFKKIAKNKKIQIKIDDILNPSFAYFDAELISIVIRNLLGNAIKFTPPNGNITISAEQAIKSGKNFLQISVKDNGIGIKKEHLHKIFDKSEPFTTFGTQNEKGSGLGLTICQDFIELNNGKIWIKSKENKGSEFIFTVPMKE